jgi:hypothetical protein
LTHKTLAKRQLRPIALLLCAGGALWYGGAFHTVQIFEPHEREISLPVPTLFGPGDAPAGEPLSSDGTPAEEADPFASPPASPPANPAQPQVKPAENRPAPPPEAAVQKLTEEYLVACEVSEWAITRDVTVGGLTRLPDGELRRTYSGKPPSLCPT